VGEGGARGDDLLGGGVEPGVHGRERVRTESAGMEMHRNACRRDDDEREEPELEPVHSPRLIGRRSRGCQNNGRAEERPLSPGRTGEIG
jgi:hypothetical protein